MRFSRRAKDCARFVTRHDGTRGRDRRAARVAEAERSRPWLTASSSSAGCARATSPSWRQNLRAGPARQGREARGGARHRGRREGRRRRARRQAARRPARPALRRQFRRRRQLDRPAACRARGVVITNTPGMTDGCVADQAMLLLLAQSRRALAHDRFVRDGKWPAGKPPLTRRVWGRKAGILGIGRIGLAIAKRCAAFDMEVGYHNRRARPGHALPALPRPRRDGGVGRRADRRLPRRRRDPATWSTRKRAGGAGQGRHHRQHRARHDHRRGGADRGAARRHHRRRGARRVRARARGAGGADADGERRARRRTWPARPSRPGTIARRWPRRTCAASSPARSRCPRCERPPSHDVDGAARSAAEGVRARARRHPALPVARCAADCPPLRGWGSRSAHPSQR